MAASIDTSSFAPKHSVISLFCHKGGVGKTTTILNLATALRYQGRTVLLVDADSQCNLTAFFMNDALLREDGDDDDASLLETAAQMPVEGGDDDVNFEMSQPGELQFSPSKPVQLSTPVPLRIGDPINTKKGVIEINSRRVGLEANSLFGLLGPFLDGLSESDFKTHLDKDCHRPLVVRGDGAKLAGFKNPPGAPPKSKVLLIPGSGRLSTLENSLRPEHLKVRGHAHKMGAFRYMIDHIAEREGVDVVLVDFGPGTNWLNELFVMSADYILPCVFADYFSIASVDMMLRNVMPKWYRDQKTLTGIELPPHQKMFRFNPYPPRLLSFLVTNYRVRDGKVGIGPSRWIKTLRALTQADHIPATQGIKAKAVPVDQISDEVKSNYLCLDQSSGMAIALAQSFTAPMLTGILNDRKGLVEISDKEWAQHRSYPEGKSKDDEKDRFHLTQSRFKQLADVLHSLPKGGIDRQTQSQSQSQSGVKGKKLKFDEVADDAPKARHVVFDEAPKASKKSKSEEDVKHTSKIPKKKGDNDGESKSAKKKKSVKEDKESKSPKSKVKVENDEDDNSAKKKKSKKRKTEGSSDDDDEDEAAESRKKKRKVEGDKEKKPKLTSKTKKE